MLRELYQIVCEMNEEENWGLSSQEAERLTDRVTPYVSGLDELPEDIQGIIKSYYQKVHHLVCGVDAAKGWGKTPQEIKKITNGVIPYVDPLDDQTEPFIKQKVIENDERDGPLVSGLMERVQSTEQNQRITEFRDYMTRVAQGRLASELRELGLDAEDLVSYAWIDILENLSSFRFESRLTTWAYTIIRNRCLQLLRIRRLELLPIEEAFSVSAEVDIEQEVENRELFDIVSEEIERFCLNMRKSKIPFEKRVLIGLNSFIEDKTNQEIAEELGLKSNTVTTIIYRMRRHLKRVLQKIYA